MVTESVARIHTLLARSARRAAGVVVLRVLLGGLASLLLALTMATLATNAGARSLALGVLVLGACAALALAAHRFWGARGLLSSRCQADRIEALRPELRGGLVTVVDRAARPQGSPSLFARLVGEVGGRLAAVRPAEVWPLAPAWREARVLLVGLVLLGGATLHGPLGPLETLAFLLASAPAQAAVAPVSDGGPRALLGDITLRYLYPSYTRLEPLEVPNTSGEVHAPLGTVVEIRARTAEVWERASLGVTGQDPVEVALEGGRVVRVQFTVTAAGSWRLDFGRMASPDYRIVPEPDFAPVVAVAGPARLRERLDAGLALNTSAKDDFGITRLVAELTVNGTVRIVELRQPLDTPLSLNEVVYFSPKAWGLKRGDEARVRVGAWDNDAVSGSKPGWSSPFVLEVLGAGGSFREQQELRADLLAALIPPLADFLVDPEALPSASSALHRWVDEAEERYVSFDGVAARTEGLSGRQFEARIVENVNSPRRNLFAFARGLGSGAVSERDAATLHDLHTTNVSALEMAVWMLDLVQRRQAYADLLALVRQMAEESRDLEGKVHQLDAPSILAKLDQIVRLKVQVETLSESLERGTIREFLVSRGAELDGAIAATRRDVSGGDRAAAAADMKRVADLLAELAGGVQEAEKRRGEADDQLGKAIAELEGDLDDLIARQESLQGQVEQARGKFGQSLEEGLAAWKRAERAAEEAVQELDSNAVEAARDARGVQGGVDDARHDAQGLLDSVRARDVARGAERAADGADSVDRAKLRLEGARRMGGLEPAEAAAAKQALDRAARAVERAAQALDELARAQSQASPQLQEALRALAGAQAELARDGREASKKADQVAKSLPTDGTGLREAAAEGADQSQRANELMQEGEAFGAGGAAGSAADAYRRAQRELEQAKEDMREMQASSRGDGKGGGGEGEEEGEGEESGGSRERARVREVAIPAPEEFATPEAYRQALIEGMQGDVPEAYRAASRRYYEELVRQ